MVPRIRELFLIVVGAVLGGFVFQIGSVVNSMLAAPGRYAFLATHIPQPYHVPQFAGGVTLRLAMVHDILHERFPKHGPAFYQERNRRTQKRLEQLTPGDPERWPLIDDYCVALDRLGEPGAGIELMRTKLAEQLAGGRAGKELYTSYANLGTLLIHSNAAQAFAGDASAVDQFAEGVELIRQSVAVNREAHFGRERWQLAIAEFMQAAMQDPELLRRFDCLGNSLKVAAYDDILDADSAPRSNSLSRYEGRYAEDDVPRFFVPGVDLSDPVQWDQLKGIRRFITHTGADSGWDQVPVPSYREAVPFDEPVLGIIGMWRQGGGANPHFALALGETMLRIGQRYIAWTAFERARLMADRFSKDPQLQQFLSSHCEQRQRDIVAHLSRGEDQPVGGPPARGADESAERIVAGTGGDLETGLQTAFQHELAFGLSLQQACQEFEQRQLEGGVDIDAVNLLEEFQQHSDPFASTVGNEELYVYARPSRVRQYAQQLIVAWTVFGAGAGALSCSVLSFLIRAFRKNQSRLRPGT